jgi:hypothetical protein
MRNCRREQECLFSFPFSTSSFVIDRRAVFFAVAILHVKLRYVRR